MFFDQTEPSEDNAGHEYVYEEEEVRPAWEIGLVKGSNVQEVKHTAVCRNDEYCGLSRPATTDILDCIKPKWVDVRRILDVCSNNGWGAQVAKIKQNIWPQMIKKPWAWNGLYRQVPHHVKAASRDVPSIGTFQFNKRPSWKTKRPTLRVLKVKRPASKSHGRRHKKWGSFKIFKTRWG